MTSQWPLLTSAGFRLGGARCLAANCAPTPLAIQLLIASGSVLLARLLCSSICHLYSIIIKIFLLSSPLSAADLARPARRPKRADWPRCTQSPPVVVLSPEESRQTVTLAKRPSSPIFFVPLF